MSISWKWKRNTETEPACVGEHPHETYHIEFGCNGSSFTYKISNKPAENWHKYVRSTYDSECVKILHTMQTDNIRYN